MKIPKTCVIKKRKKLRLGKNVSFNDYVFINAAGGVSIGDNTLIAPFVMIHGANHKYKDAETLIRKQGHTELGVFIGSDVLISAHVAILVGSHIPSGCVIGAHSLVTRNDELERLGVYTGNPLRLIRRRRKDGN